MIELGDLRELDRRPRQVAAGGEHPGQPEVILFPLRIRGARRGDILGAGLDLDHAPGEVESEEVVAATALAYHLFEQHLVLYKQHVRSLKVRAIEWKDSEWAASRSCAQVVRELEDVANASKHGEGTAAARLKKSNPRLFVDPAYELLRVVPTRLAATAPFAGEGPFVREADLTRYQDGVEAFWNEIASAHMPGAGQPPSA